MVEMKETATRIESAERKIVEMFDADRQAFVSVQAMVDDGVSRIEVSVSSADESQVAYTVSTGTADDIDSLIEAVISELKYQGAFAA